MHLMCFLVCLALALSILPIYLLSGRERGCAGFCQKDADVWKCLCKSLRTTKLLQTSVTPTETDLGVPLQGGSPCYRLVNTPFNDNWFRVYQPITSL